MVEIDFKKNVVTCINLVYVKIKNKKIDRYLKTIYNIIYIIKKYGKCYQLQGATISKKIR